MHDSLVTAAFSGLFLLKMANLFPAELDLAAISAQVEQLASLLSDVAAERYVPCHTYQFQHGPLTCLIRNPLVRYALTLRIMLANLRRKMGMVPGVMQNQQPAMEVPAFMDPSLVPPPPPPPPFTREELGVVTWPSTADERIFSPSAIPLWLQEQVRCAMLQNSLMGC